MTAKTTNFTVNTDLQAEHKNATPLRSLLNLKRSEFVIVAFSYSNVNVQAKRNASG
jgi:hypothetical protein